MALNGDSVVAEGERKVADVTHKMLHLLNEAMERVLARLLEKFRARLRKKKNRSLWSLLV